MAARVEKYKRSTKYGTDILIVSDSSWATGVPILRELNSGAVSAENRAGWGTLGRKNRKPLIGTETGSTSSVEILTLSPDRVKGDGPMEHQADSIAASNGSRERSPKNVFLIEFHLLEE